MMKAQNIKFKLLRSSIFAVMVLLITSLVSAASFLANDKPFSKKQILNLVKKPAIFSDEEITKDITTRKVDFEVSAAVETELIDGGASPVIVASCRTNYQPGKAPVANDNNPPPKQGTPPPKSGGAAMSKEEILTMLRKRVTPARIEKTVETRGVDFQVNPEVTNELKAAGGSALLIGTIATHYVGASNTNTSAGTNTKISTNPPIKNTKNVPTGPTYADYIDQALNALRVRDMLQVRNATQKAINIDNAKPQAYYLLGYANLYLAGNVVEARANFNSAIERGGEVSFIVLNDRKNAADKGAIIMEGVNKIGKIFKRDRSNTNSTATATAFQNTCKGSLFITKNRIKFQADDNKNSFDVPASQIAEVLVNKNYGIERFAFHVKVKGASSDNQNYNFSMLSSQPNAIQPFTKDETNLAISLIDNEKARASGEK